VIPAVTTTSQIITSVVIFLAVGAAAWLGVAPMWALVLRRQAKVAAILHSRLLLDVSPRAVTIISLLVVVIMGFIGYGLTSSALGAMLGGSIGLFVPVVVLRLLWIRRVNRLESQLVSGIQTIASGVRAGLNLVQSMELVARDGPIPLRQEFAHMLREYEYGVSLEEAMDNTAERIGSGDFRLLFAALRTHRERGGDLGATLDRIAESIREIQRLENRVKTLTAQGKATARWLGAMPLVVLAIHYFLISPEDTTTLFTEDVGKLILGAIIILNVAGFLWIRKIVSIDI